MYITEEQINNLKPFPCAEKIKEIVKNLPKVTLEEARAQIARKYQLLAEREEIRKNKEFFETLDK